MPRKTDRGEPLTGHAKGKPKKFTEQTAGKIAGFVEREGEKRTIKAIGITADVVNGNNRIYPATVLAAAVADLRDHLHESAGQGRVGPHR